MTIGYTRHMFEPHAVDPDIHLGCWWCGRIASDSEFHFQDGEPMTHRDDLAAALGYEGEGTNWTWPGLIERVTQLAETAGPLKPPVATPAQLIRNAALLLGEHDSLTYELLSYVEQLEERERDAERRRTVNNLLTEAGLRPTTGLIDSLLAVFSDD